MQVNSSRPAEEVRWVFDWVGTIETLVARARMFVIIIFLSLRKGMGTR